MKKFFRMASVIALACASLTYTSCTKDYDEEINTVNKNVEALQSKLQGEIDGLKSDVASLKSGLSSLESAYKAADAALQKGIDANASAIADLTKKVSANETAIAQLNAAIAKFATKDELAAKATELEGKIAAVATDLASAKEEILAKATALEAELKAVKEQVAADEAKLAAVEEALAAINDVYAACSDELRSIVFIPDLYFAGIEATEYTFAVINAQDYVYYLDKDKKQADLKTSLEIKTLGNAGTPSGETTVVIAKGQPLYTTATQTPILDKDGKPTKETKDLAYTLGQQGVAKYQLNPSSFNVEKAEWALYGMDRQYVTKGEEAAWKPVFEGIEVVDGVAEVKYSIEGAENMLATVDTAETYSAMLGVVPVMNLVATLDSAKTVASDYEAILVSPEGISSLAFAQANKYVTEKICSMPKNNKELYDFVGTAIENMPSVDVVYNGGDVDLAKLITIHMTGETEMTLAELNAAYGDQFTMTFDNINYIVGDNKTAESMYAKVSKEGIYTPMYVKTGATASSVPCAVGDKAGISSVGRQPVILVTLWNNDQVVLGQYFKVEVVESARVADNTVVEIPSLGNIPYICDSVELATTWHQFSDLVLETVGVSYAQFAEEFEIEEYESSDSVVVYVKVVDEKGVESFVDSINIGTEKKPEIVCVKDYYGFVEYNEDSATDGVNNAFVWAAEPQAIGAGKDQTVYVHFSRGKYENVYVALNASVAPKAAYTYGKKIANEWYNDIDNEYKNTGRLNVPVPVADKTTPVKGGDVTKFSRDVNHFLQGYVPSITLTADSDPIYAQIASKNGSPLASKESIAPAIEYTFSAEQPAIDGIQLYTNAEGDSLFAAKYDSKGKIVTKKVNGKDVPVLDPARLIAYFEADSASVITYKWAEGETIAKELLNKWSYKETEQAKMLYANIDVALTYGECEIPAGDDHFHVRFVRPLDINFAGQDVSEESAVDGFNVELVKFIAGITDWNNQAVIVDSLDKNKKPTGNMIANVIKTVDMYAYYQFDELEIDLANATRNNVDADAPDTFKKLADVTPGVKLAIGTADKDGVFTANTAENANVVDIESFDAIKGIVLNYRNDEAVVEAFTLRIPVKVSYAWGTIEGTFEINVKKTADTEGK